MANLEKPDPPLQGKTVKDPDWERNKDEPRKKQTGSVESREGEVDPEQYPKTLYHTNSQPWHLIGRTVADPTEEATLGTDWVPLASLGFETAPAADAPPQLVEDVGEVTTGLLNMETGTPVIAVDTFPDRQVTATAARGILSQPSPAGPPLPRNPAPGRSGGGLQVSYREDHGEKESEKEKK